MDAETWLEELETSGHIRIRKESAQPGEAPARIVTIGGAHWGHWTARGGLDTSSALPIQGQESGTARLAGVFGNVYP